MNARISRRAMAQLLVVSSLAVSLTACSNSGDKADKSGTARSTSTVATTTVATTTVTPSAEAAAANAQEVTISTLVGKDNVEEKFPTSPKRVLAMGQTAIDNLLTIGVVPDVIVISDREKGIPWQAEKLKNAQVIPVKDFKDFAGEQIAAAKPDLIVGDQWRVNKEVFDKLTAIAPTLGAVKDGDKNGWVAQVEALGKIYNKTDVAQAAIKEHDALFAQARKDMPGLKGKSGVISQFIGPQKAFGVVADPNIPGTSFLKDLGMVVPEKLAAEGQKDSAHGGRIMVSAENVSMLAADFMIIGPRKATVEEIKAVPGFEDLPQVKDGATRFAEKPYLLQALNQPSALSLAYALKELTPELKKAAGEK